MLFNSWQESLSLCLSHDSWFCVGPERALGWLSSLHCCRQSGLWGSEFWQEAFRNLEQQIKSMWESATPDTRANTDSLPPPHALSSLLLAHTNTQAASEMKCSSSLSAVCLSARACVWDISSLSFVPSQQRVKSSCMCAEYVAPGCGTIFPGFAPFPEAHTLLNSECYNVGFSERSSEASASAPRCQNANSPCSEDRAALKSLMLY